LVPARNLAEALDISESEAFVIADIWQVDTPEQPVDVFELLSALVSTSGVLTLRSKQAFLFRMWDMDSDMYLNTAELAFLFRTLVAGLAKYCRWAPSGLPEAKALRKYVERTFKPRISEADFTAWASRHRLFRTTLAAFTTAKPDGGGAALDGSFTLPGPPLSTRRRGDADVTADSNQKSAVLPKLPPGRPLSGLPGDGRQQTPGSARGANRTKAGEVGAVALPKVVNRRSSVGLVNKPVNLVRCDIAEGSLKMLHARASWEDLEHMCVLHKDVGREQCLQLSKHEVLLANRLYHFLSHNRDLKGQGVKQLLKKLQIEVATHDSFQAQSDHRNIFWLTDARHNRIFDNCVRGMRKGKETSFRDFLAAVCPCASDARLELMVTWHVSGHWRQEQEFIASVKTWRSECEAHWKKKTISPRDRRRLEEQMTKMDVDGDHVLSVSDIVVGSGIPQEVAEAVMQKHDLNGDAVLNANEFFQMFCPDGDRTKANSAFEEMLLVKFARVEAQWKTGAYSYVSVHQPQCTTEVFDDIDDDDNGGVTLDELVGHLDVKSAFGFMEAYDLDHDGSLSLAEFEHLVDPDQAALLQ